MKRILLCDDHQIVLEGLQASLEGLDEAEVVGAYLTSKELLERLQGEVVDLVILDINLADIDGVALARHVKRHWPKVAVMALTFRNDIPTVRGFLATGAEGYVLKTDPTWQILDAVGRVLRGQRTLSADLTGFLMEELQLAGHSGDLLSRGEREVLRLLCEGKINKQIATTLGVSVTTVERRRASLMHKSGCRTAAELSLWAARADDPSRN
ncbi:MAG: response regulator transcription factor [Spirochaetales bacterium]